MIQRALWAVVLCAGCCVQENRCPAEYVPRYFSEKYICPPDRVVARERPDLPYHRFVCTGPDACGEQPPAELGVDPERIALWRRSTFATPGSKVDDRATATFEVSGCGERRFYACSRTYFRGRPTIHCEGSSLIDLGTQEPPPDR
jgi:hypothetical protein